MSDESNPAFSGPAAPSRSVRLGLSLPPVDRLPLGSVRPGLPGSHARNPVQSGARPMLRSALRVLMATRRIWREPLA